MESPINDGVSKISESLHREMQFAKEDKPQNEVPEVGDQSSQKVTKSPEPIELSGAFSNDKTLAEQMHCPQPGEPMQSVDNVDDAGIDCTREPDWEVVEQTQLPPEPKPNQVHNDRYWEERSLDTELQDQDLQDEAIREETENFDRAAEAAEDFSRYNSNEVLDPYYQSGSDSSNPPSSGNSLDSFV